MKIFLDVGAFDGDTAKAVLTGNYNFDKIYCFEPVSALAEKIKELKSDKICIMNFGLWNQTCTKKLYKSGSNGGSIFKDKFTHAVDSTDINLVKASNWFKENIPESSIVYLKLNCEGAECDILDDLIDSGEIRKVTVAMVDFDVRKIPSQKDRETRIRERLALSKVPVVFPVERVDQYRWSKRHADWTHYWIEKTSKEVIKMKQKTEELSLITHLPLLVRVFDKSKGDVLEVGTGYFSTLILDWLASFTHRHVYSYESREYWYQRAKKYEGPYHHIVYTPNWDKADFGGKKHWGMVFIDHGPDQRRVVEIERLANKTDYMVIHDTDPKRDKQYGYSAIFPLFKYRLDDKKVVPWTSVVSNFKKLDDIA